MSSTSYVSSVSQAPSRVVVQSSAKNDFRKYLISLSAYSAGTVRAWPSLKSRNSNVWNPRTFCASAMDEEFSS